MMSSTAGYSKCGDLHLVRGCRVRAERFVMSLF